MNSQGVECRKHTERFDAQIAATAMHSDDTDVLELPTPKVPERRDSRDGFLLADRVVRPKEGTITPPTGKAFHVEPKVMDVLFHLVRADGELVTRGELLDRFWYPGATCDTALTRVVCTLRRVLGDRSRRPRFIQTVHKRGYRLLVSTAPLPQEQATNRASPAAPAIDGGRDAPAGRRGGFSGFMKEMRRRRVIQVASAYALVGWLVIQIGEATFEPLLIPSWCLTLLVLFVALGLPIAIVLAWAVQMTDHGAVLDMPVEDLSGEESSMARTGLRYVLVIGLLAAIGVLSYQLFAAEPQHGAEIALSCGADEVLPLQRW